MSTFIVVLDDKGYVCDCDDAVDAIVQAKEAAGVKFIARPKVEQVDRDSYTSAQEFVSKYPHLRLIECGEGELEKVLPAGEPLESEPLDHPPDSAESTETLPDVSGEDEPENDLPIAPL